MAKRKASKKPQLHLCAAACPAMLAAAVGGVPPVLPAAV